MVVLLLVVFIYLFQFGNLLLHYFSTVKMKTKINNKSFLPDIKGQNCKKFKIQNHWFIFKFQTLLNYNLGNL